MPLFFLEFDASLKVAVFDRSLQMWIHRPYPERIKKAGERISNLRTSATQAYLPMIEKVSSSLQNHLIDCLTTISRNMNVIFLTNKSSLRKWEWPLTAMSCSSRSRSFQLPTQGNGRGKSSFFGKVRKKDFKNRSGLNFRKKV